MIIGYHIVISGYGTWLSNDIRGIGSDETRKDELEELGPVHTGRKPIQPSKNDLRQFYREAEPLLDFPTLWFSEPQRAAVAKGFGQAAQQNNYTIWACAVCRNHTHLCVRRHRHQALEIRDALANGARESLLKMSDIDPAHPIWSSRSWAVYLSAPRDIVGRVDYVEKNPEKEGLPRQHWDFVKPYDGWTGHPGTRAPRK